MDNESRWQKQLLIGVIALLAVGVIIGGIVGVAGIKAAQLVGIGESRSTGAEATIQTRPDPPTSTSASTSGKPRPDPPRTTASSAPPSTGSTPPHRSIMLWVSPRATSTYQRISFTGTYQASAGTSLQVQRMEAGSWVDFPTTASVDAGTFSTYIETGHTGINRFRVTDVGSGKSSNTVTVRVS